MGEPVLSAWLNPVASSRGTTDKDLVQRHCEKADEVDARIRTLTKQLRVANAARNELELQIAQLHALGPEAAWRQRMLVAEAAAAAAATAAAAEAEAEAATARERRNARTARRRNKPRRKKPRSFTRFSSTARRT